MTASQPLGPTDASPPPDAATANGGPGHSASLDLQILLQMTTLFERNPALIGELLQDATETDGGGLALIFAAACDALDNRPDCAALHVYAAMAALRLGNSPTAQRLLDRAVQMTPKDARAWLLLAETSVILNNPTRARQCAERARALCTSHLPQRESKQGRSGNELPA